MNTRLSALLTSLLLCATLLASEASAAPRIDPKLAEQVVAAPLQATPVVITWTRKPGATEIAALKLLGVSGGIVLQEMPMVLTAVNQSQFEALRSRADVKALWGNRLMRHLTSTSRKFIGLENMQRDAELTARNGGLPHSGRDVGIAYVDTGIDATHPDLQLGRNVIQNVFFPIGAIQTGLVESEVAAATGISVAVPELPREFVPPIFIENAPISENEAGHGTFGAAISAGSGAASGGFYGGVAPGARLIGLHAGNDFGLTTFSILQAYDYALTRQVQYNIRVVNNSFGATLAGFPYDPSNPLIDATRILHDRFMAVVFAAGNGIDSVGDRPGAINTLSVAPWVISVGAGEKQGLGRLTGFSSRGENDGGNPDTAGQPANPAALPNLRPDLIAPGADIKSARSKAPGVSSTLAGLPIFVGGNDPFTIPPAFLPYYTTGQGTSFAAPHVSGVVALMLEANPMLTPDDVVTLLRATATPMPYTEREVGSGYVDAHNAVRAAASLLPVDHPALLFPVPGSPQIADPEGDQIGTTAQDIVWGRLEYDATARQVVYSLRLFDLANATTNSKWVIGSKFHTTTVFVAGEITELGTHQFEYGNITVNPTTGTSTQATLGDADSGTIDIANDTVTIRLGIDKINAAVPGDADVLYSTSTQSFARGQITLGSPTVQPLLFLNADQAEGGDFRVGDPPPPPPPPPEEETNPNRVVNERHPGTLVPGQGSVDVPFTMRRDSLAAKITWHPKNETMTLGLYSTSGTLLASAQGQELRATLAPGEYVYRVSGSPGKQVDFVIRSKQRRAD
jgi:subtilisin family serine protease